MSAPTRAIGLGQAENPKDLVVGQTELAGGIDHAQPMRHIVERGVEARCELGDLDSGGDLGQEGLFQAVRGSLDEQKERDEPDDDGGGGTSRPPRSSPR